MLTVTFKRTLAWFTLGLTAVAAAQQPPPVTERRKINPVAIHGTWIGLPGTMPTDCAADGFMVALGTTNGQTFQMTVQHRQNGLAPLKGKETLFTVMEPPPGAPLRIDVFLTSKDSDMGVVIRTGSAMELVPAGPDKAYGATSLFLKRCS